MTQNLFPIAAKGLLIEWFDVLGDASDLTPVVSDIERDRADYAARPGFVRKLLPIVTDVITGASYSGGSYLFDTVGNAQVHHHWATVERKIDGVAFPDQPWLANFDGFIGEVVGAVDVGDDLSRHAAKRIVVWKAGTRPAREVAAALWTRLLALLARQPFVSVWLGVDDSANTLGLVLVCSRPADSGSHSYAAFELLRGIPLFDEGVLPPDELVVDRCMWVFTIWLPPVHGQPTEGLWPNSPPLPAPAGHRSL